MINYPNFRPYTNIQPFTVRDGATYLLVLEGLKDWIRDALVPHLNEEMLELVNSWEATVTELVDGINSLSVELNGQVQQQLADQVSQFNDIVNQIINSSIELQDAVLQTIFNDPESEYRQLLDTLYAGKGIEDDISNLEQSVLDTEEAVDTIGQTLETGRLSPSELSKQRNQHGGTVAVTGTDLAALEDALAEAESSGYDIHIPQGTIVTIDDTFDLSPGVNMRIDGHVQIDANVPGIRVSGAVGGTVEASAMAASGGKPNMGVVVVNPSSFSVGDDIFIHSEDLHPRPVEGTSVHGAKLGYGRKIVAVDGSTLYFDTQIPRTMSTDISVTHINRAVPTTIYGTGKVYYADKYASPNGRAILANFCRGFRVLDIEVFNTGNDCVTLNHCDDSYVNAYLHDALNDENNGHYGYGVGEAGGRNNLIEGRIENCRHAVSSVPGIGFSSLAPLNFAVGEPEFSVYKPKTANCTNRALSTHAVGWGIRMILDDVGSVGGVDLRADASFASGISRHGTGPAIRMGETNSTPFVVSPTVGEFVILENRNPTNGHIMVEGGSLSFLSRPRIIGGTGPDYSLFNGAQITGIGTSDILILKDDVTVPDTEWVNIPELSFTVNAGEQVLFEMLLIYTAHPDADLQLGIVPSPFGDSVFNWVSDALHSGSTNQYGEILRTVHSTAGATATLAGNGSGTAELAAKPEGSLVMNTSSGGTVTPRFRQAVANATASSVKAGSVIKVTRTLRMKG